MMNKAKIAAAGALVALSTASMSAMAALPAGVTTVITGVQEDGQSLFDLVFPAVGLMVALGLVITLFKRFTKKI